MAGISDEDIQKVREASDIVDVIGERVPLRQRGRDFWCCCPFHEEKTPSCKIDPSTQLFYCFGCHKGGDVFKFVQDMEGIDFPDAVRRLADRAHIELTETGGRAMSSSYKQRLKDVAQTTCEFYHSQLMRLKSPEADNARAYLSGRSLGGEVPKRWMLGFAPGKGALVAHLRSAGFSNKEIVDANVGVTRNGRVNDRFFDRIMFPIFDEGGDCIAFGGRVIGPGEPKYLNSQETPLFHKSRVLYGLDKAKASMTSSGEAIVVEGYTDVIALHEGGVTNAVATLGTALTKQHIQAISRHASKRIVYLFDGDEAGQRAADRALEFIGETMTPESGRRQIDLVACTLPDNLDPADFVAQRGVDALRACIEEAKPLIAYGIDRRIAACDTASAEGRSRAVIQALSVLAPIKDSLLAKDYAVQIAGRLRLRESDVLDRLAKLKPPRAPYANTSHTNASDTGASRAGVSPAGDASAADFGQVGASQSEAESVRLSETEVSRRRFEANLLSACAKHPALAARVSQDLAMVSWHVPLHENVAAAVLDAIAADQQASPARITATIVQSQPAAARLFASSVPEGVDAQDYIAYLIEELSIGDAEAAVEEYRAQLAKPEALSSEEYDLLFQTVANLQKDLAARKLKHSKTFLQ